MPSLGWSRWRRDKEGEEEEEEKEKETELEKQEGLREELEEQRSEWGGGME